MYYKTIKIIQLLMGIDYLVNGLNWWFKMITPYPSLSDFAQNPPPPDMVGAMIQTGFMFHIVKVTEILAGLALLSNRFVPLMLVAVFPITLSVCLVDVILVASLRGYVMGLGAFTMNTFLMLTYFNHYQNMFTPLAQPNTQPNQTIRLPEFLQRKVMPVFAGIALLFGITMVAWVGLMIFQYALNPLPLGG